MIKPSKWRVFRWNTYDGLGYFGEVGPKMSPAFTTRSGNTGKTVSHYSVPVELCMWKGKPIGDYYPNVRRTEISLYPEFNPQR